MIFALVTSTSGNSVSCVDSQAYHPLPSNKRVRRRQVHPVPVPFYIGFSAPHAMSLLQGPLKRA